MPKHPDIPVDGSWRMVEGDENDSFDTSVVHGDDQEPFHLSPPSQLSSGGPMSIGGSQDSIGDFVSRADDERNILRSPFQPSLPEARQTPRRKEKAGQGARTPDPEFIMPAVEVDTRGGYNLRRRAPRQGDGQGSPPKRKVRTRHVYGDEAGGRETIGERVAATLPNATLGALSWLFGVITMAFRYAQRPLAVLLAIYFFCGGLIMVQNMITQSLFVSLSPLCRIPGVSYLDLAFCPRPTMPTGPGQDGATTGHVVEFDDLMTVQGQFERVLEKSAEGVSLPLEMKRSESSIRDLRTMVRYSELPAREELAQEFDGYIDAARSSTSELQRFNARVGSAVDSIISVNRWTARYLDSLDAGETASPDAGLLWSWAGWVFAPFGPAVPDGVFDEGALRDRYVEHTALLSERVAGLVLEANAILRHLARAEGHLALIYEISTRAGNSVRSRRDRVLHTLWSLVGANSRALGSLNGQLALLGTVDAQRSAAVSQLSALVVDLEAIEAGLADLRERVAGPEVVGRPAAVPLTVHVETIDRGVERLEGARKRIRAVENERIREALARGGVMDERLLEGQ